MDQASNPVWQYANVEIDQQPDWAPGMPQVSQHLSRVDWVKASNRFYFYNYALFNQKVQAIEAFNFDAVIRNAERGLPYECKSGLFKLDRQTGFVARLQQSGT